MAILRTSEKRTSLTVAEYDGLARDGEIIVDLSNYSLWVGNATGNLVPISGGTANLPPGGGPGWLLSTDGQGNYSWVRPCCVAEPFVLSATWQAGSAGADQAFYYDPVLDETVPNPKPLLVNYTLPVGSVAASISTLSINGIDIDETGIIVGPTSMTIPAANIPDEIQTETGTISLTLTLLDTDGQQAGPETTVVTPTLVVTTFLPLDVSGIPRLVVSQGAAVPFWQTPSSATITVDNLALQSGTITAVTYQLKDSDGNVIATSSVQPDLSNYTFIVTTLGTGLRVTAIIEGYGEDDVPATLYKNSDPVGNPGNITTLGTLYTPLMSILGTITPPTLDPLNPAFTVQGSAFSKPGTCLTEDTRPSGSGKYYWIAVPNNAQPVKFYFSVPPFLNVNKPADAGNDGSITQTLQDSEGNDVVYTLYGFTNGAPITFDILNPI
jgi:hypothetical protein